MQTHKPPRKSILFDRKMNGEIGKVLVGEVTRTLWVSSCRSLVRQDGALQFPAFSYRRVPNSDEFVGADVQYFLVTGKTYKATGRHFTTRFTEPNNVFKFELE